LNIPIPGREKCELHPRVTPVNTSHGGNGSVGAGVAAAVSLKEGVNVGGVDIKYLQDALRKQGVRLD
jgi:hypothetical protein